MAFNLFKKKDSPGGGPDPAAPGPAGAGAEAPGAEAAEPFRPQPEKARRFFEHARAVFDASNYEYSMTLWLQGLRLDPANIEAMESFFKACAAFLGANPRAKGPTKDQLKSFGAKGPVERFLLALLNWGTRPDEWSMGEKAMAAAADLKLAEQVYWIGDRVLRRALADPKAKKHDFVAMMSHFEKVGAFDKALIAGDKAVQLDPTDQRLANAVRNMSAQATIARGGYEATGQAGGFRKNIRDLAGQTAREEEERLVKSEEAITRVIERAREDLAARPSDQAAIQKYAKALLDSGRPEDEKIAYQVLMKGYEDTKAYKFREQAGNIRMKWARRKLADFEESMKNAPPGEETSQKLANARREVLEFEIAEFRERVAAYPTNLEVKYRLGERLVQAGRFDEAIEQLQLAEGAPGMQSTVRNMLAQCFARMGWLDEAEGTFRKALEDHPNPNDDLGFELRYGLMDALERKARESNDPALADEALKLASGITVQKIGYRDVRARREAIQALVKQLRAK